MRPTTRWTSLLLALLQAPLLAALPCPSSAAAQAQPPDTSTAAPAGTRPSLRAARRAGPVKVDGRLDESAWAAAPAFTEFLQYEPDEGHPASERTEVRVLVDDAAIYVGARMYDREPGKIRARLARRDDGTESDLFEVYFDTFLDRLTAVTFRVNPAGALLDAVILASGDYDGSWDAVWEGAATVDSLGWCAEMRIPLTQLHYNSAAEAVWGMQIERFIHRRQELDVFAFTPKKQSGGVSRYGRLEGLGRLSSTRHFELLPFVVGRAEYRDVPAANPFRNGHDFFGDAGLDLKYDLGRDLRLTATVNPDFGQAEVDPAEVNLSAYETFYSEKRPFFVEGSGHFSFGRYRSMNNFGFGEIFYSRRIGRPPHVGLDEESFQFVDAPDQGTILGAAKLTGTTRTGWSLGLLDAVTARQRARFALPPSNDDGVAFNEHGALGDSVVEPPTNYFVGRVRRDLRDGATSVGALVTAVNRSASGRDLAARVRSSAYLAGFDFNHAWDDRMWSFDGFLAQSYVRGSAEAIAATQRSSAHYFLRPDQEHVRYDPTRTSLSGYQGALALAKNSGEHWLGSVTTQFMSPGYEANDLGYETRADRYTLATILLYKEDRPGKLLRNFRLFPYTYHAWNYGGKNITAGYAFVAEGLLANYWYAEARFTIDPPVYNDQLTRGGPMTRTADGREVRLELYSDSRKPYQVGGEVYHWWNDRGGHGLTLEPSLSFRPSPGLKVQLGPAFDRQHVLAQYVTTVVDATAAATYGSRYVFATLDQTTVSFATRLNWTLSPRASLQLYLQPLVVAGAYTQFKELRAPSTFDFDVYGQDRGTFSCDPSGDYLVDPDGGGPAAAFGFGNPDFNFRSLRGNAVLRWEYRPGSTLYLIWQQTREDQAPTGGFDFHRDFRALFDRKPDNIFMAKITTWFGV